MNKHIFTILLGFIIGTLYYRMMSKSIPKEVNCSFSANIWTDIFAFIAGFIMLYKGYFYDDVLVTLLGVTIITEHIWQFYYNKI